MGAVVAAVGALAVAVVAVAAGSNGSSGQLVYLFMQRTISHETDPCPRSAIALRGLHSHFTSAFLLIHTPVLRQPDADAL